MNGFLRASSLMIIYLLLGCTTRAPMLDTKQIHSNPIIVDHNAVDLQQIPISYVEKTLRDFGISYGHTSHGSQIISGMHELKRRDSLFSFGSSANDSVLTIFDKEPIGDLGNPNRTEWELRTREMLDNGWGDVNIVVWSWCGQVSNASKEDIDLYLNLMSRLEEDYSGVVFVYMTGHLDGSGENGNLHKRNEQIRKFCRDNNKILYDFADIERYDPDGNDYLAQKADAGCFYISNKIQRNWAKEWCDRNPDQCIDYRCAHSEPLNCDRKAAAFWWMLARIAGWTPEK